MSEAASLAGLAIHTLFRGHARQLVQWCNFHLGAGVDRIYVALDCPAPGFVESLPQDPRIEWRVVDHEAWDALYPPGAANFERKLQDSFRVSARLAEAAGLQHLAFIDTDELLVLAEPFAAIAQSHPDATAITVPVREMWFAAGDSRDEPFGATLGLRRSTPRTINWRRQLGWRAQFLRNGLFAHDAGKSIYRLPLVAGGIGSHRPTSGSLKAGAVQLPLERGALLHHDAGSFPVWNEKWGLRLQGDTVAVKIGAQRRAQEALFANVLRRSPEDQRAFFEEFYSADAAAEQALTEAGVAARIDVQDRLDAPLPVPELDLVDLRRLPELGRRVDFQFALVCDQRFVKPTFATMASVLSEMGPLGSVRFVVLGDGLEAADVRRLEALEQADFDVEVLVRDITADLDRDVGTEDKKRATFGRIYLVDYLPTQRTLYLDGDVLATRPFPELFSMDLGGAALAGVSDSAGLRMQADPASVPLQQRSRLTGITQGDPPDYINGGVLIFDLDNPDFFELAMRARALVVLQGHALQQRDQDAMNLAFVGRKHRLPSTYNYMTQFYVSERALTGELLRRKYDNADATLVHFSGKRKPWESQDDEFYNGLYRSLVAAAEEKVGLSCDFYFSRRISEDVRRSPGGWAATLAPVPPPVHAGDSGDDVELVDLSDRGLYLRIATPTYLHAVREGLQVVGRSGSEVLFEVPVARLTPPRNHLIHRVGAGVRFLPVDLKAAFAPREGVVRDLELALAHPGRAFDRTVLTRDLVAAGARPAAGEQGALTELHDGWLRGVVDRPAAKAGATVSLYVDGALAAHRAPETGGEGGKGTSPRFAFNLTRILGLGYAEPGSAPEIAVHFTGTNLPLTGSGFRLPAADQRLRCDRATGEWAVVEPEREPTASRVRAGLGRVKRRLQG